MYEDEELDEALIEDLVLNSYALVVSKLKKLDRQRIALLKTVGSRV